VIGGHRILMMTIFIWFSLSSPNEERAGVRSQKCN
jgi:hypothetical protein